MQQQRPTMPHSRMINNKLMPYPSDLLASKPTHKWIMKWILVVDPCLLWDSLSTLLQHSESMSSFNSQWLRPSKREIRTMRDRGRRIMFPLYKGKRNMAVDPVLRARRATMVATAKPGLAIDRHHWPMEWEVKVLICRRSRVMQASRADPLNSTSSSRTSIITPMLPPTRWINRIGLLETMDSTIASATRSGAPTRWPRASSHRTCRIGRSWILLTPKSIMMSTIG